VSAVKQSARSTSKANLVIPEVPLKNYQISESFDSGTKRGFQTGQLSIPEVPSSKGEISSQQKNLKFVFVFVIIAALAVTGVAVSMDRGSSSADTNKMQASKNQMSEMETKPSPTPPASEEESTPLPNNFSEFPIAYLYNSTGIRIFQAEELSIPNVEKTTLLISRNGTDYKNMVSQEGDVKSFKIVKVDTVGQSKFVIKLNLKDGVEIQSRPLLVPGDFSLT
jgi:hypothetical protein